MFKSVLAVLKNLKGFFSNIFNEENPKLPYIITSLVGLLIVVGGIKLFIELTRGLMSDLMKNSDTAISEAVWSFRSEGLTDYFVFVTNVGDALGYVIVFALCTLIFSLVFKNWGYVGQIILVLVLALSSNLILKSIINRARPDVEHLVIVETLSYPSGHAMMSMAFYGMLIYIISQFKMNQLIKFLIVLLLILLILSIGISRIYLGVHYPSDIAGGYIAGFIWVIFCIMIFNLIKIFRRDPDTPSIS